MISSMQSNVMWTLYFINSSLYIGSFFIYSSLIDKKINSVIPSLNFDFNMVFWHFIMNINVLNYIPHVSLEILYSPNHLLHKFEINYSTFFSIFIKIMFYQYFVCKDIKIAHGLRSL